MSLRVLSCNGVHGFTGWRALNVCHIRHNVSQLTINFRGDKAFEEGAVYPVWPFDLNHCDTCMPLIEWLFVFFGD